MKKIVLLLITLAFLLSACGQDDPADIAQEPGGQTPDPPEPVAQLLERVEISGSGTLVLKKVEIAPDQSRVGTRGPERSRISAQSAARRCDELGTLNGAVYTKNTLHGNQAPCFKNVRLWDGEQNTIFGQYSPGDSSPDVWFITDATGKIHHLKKTPKKGAGFKNDKRIGKYKGKPTFLTEDDFIVSYDMSTDEEEEVVSTRVSRFVVINKSNGDHLIYKDMIGGKRKRPDGTQDEIDELNYSGMFYKNTSGDLQYVASGGKFKNLTFDASGNILERAASSVPVAFQNWLGTTDVPPPYGPRYNNSFELCDRSDNLMLCTHESIQPRGFLIADSSQDMKEINWYDLGISGGNPRACMTEDFIYYAAGENLRKISKDLSASEIIMSGISVYTLDCPDNDNLIIHGYSAAASQYETFRLDVSASPMVKTPITEDIASFIR